MALMDEPVWRGKIFSGGWNDGDGGDAPVIEPATGQEIGRTGIASPADVARAAQLAATGIVHINEQTVDDEPNIPFGRLGASGTGARFGGTANLEAFTDTRWVTIRGDIAPYPF
jgi:acyl-CoA reductase-like NAD-dependent aldehyde dehydrogenase